MKWFEQYILICLGFIIFSIVFIRIGFFVNVSITSFTLPFSLILYCLSLFIAYLTSWFYKKKNISHFLPFFLFIFTMGVFWQTSILLSHTYDTSWDGQGYHQTAVIALANVWNPITTRDIPFHFRLPSQIFAEGYPSALWEIEGSIYAFFHIINSAKVMNFFMLFLAFGTMFILFRKLSINAVVSMLIALCIVSQPVFLIQAISFMEDGFGYELLLVASTAVILFCLDSQSIFAISCFTFAELLLVTTKYSNLPIAFVLGVIFCAVLCNRFLGKIYTLSPSIIASIIGFFLLTSIFFYLPYGRNIVFHRAIFYPTNFPNLMGSVTYNNVPNNLQKSNKLSLLFYGIFSRAQSEESGDPRSKSNIAELKIPFTFSSNELIGSAFLYNNRVGAGGPLFSGLVVFAAMLLVVSYVIMETQKERYSIYAAIFCLLLVLGLSLLAPTPNLLRYVNQLQLIPFIVMIPILATFKQKLLRILCVFLLFISLANSMFFSYAILQKDISEANSVNKEFSAMRNSGKTYQVRTEQFYSSYIILKEQNIAFIPVTSVSCAKISYLFASSTTTQYCVF